MKRRIFLGLAAAGALAGCGRSRNGSGQSGAQPLTDQQRNPLMPEAGEGSIFDNFRKEPTYAGTPIEAITGLVVERASGGAIIRVRGTAARQDVFDVRLVPDRPDGEPSGGVLGYTLSAVRPEEMERGAARPREVQVAVFVSGKTLQSVREIRVRGVQNARVSRP